MRSSASSLQPNSGPREEALQKSPTTDPPPMLAVLLIPRLLVWFCDAVVTISRVPSFRVWRLRCLCDLVIPALIRRNEVAGSHNLSHGYEEPDQAGAPKLNASTSCLEWNCLLSQIYDSLLVRSNKFPGCTNATRSHVGKSVHA